LKTEVENSRKKSEEAMRRERTLLQHEVDILNQKLTQEVLTLKDELKGMFDDRKMTVRQEQRAMESAVSPPAFMDRPAIRLLVFFTDIFQDSRIELQNHGFT
jgi:hypothetical protein